MLAVLCPGQGAQQVGMGVDLRERFPIARDTFEEANDILGFDLAGLCGGGPEDELTETRNAQPAILVHTVAAWRVLTDAATPRVEYAAGHSLGEFSAYVIAGALSFPDALRIVRRRGELMYMSGADRPGAMAALIGLDDDAVIALCSEATAAGGGVVVPANFNAPGQIVISGDVPAVERAVPLAKEAGARRVILLNVSGAFHSPLMEVAGTGLAEALRDAAFEDPSIPVVSNVTAEPVRTAGEARKLLVRQLVSPVRWTDSMRFLMEAGVGEILEPGPGKVLSGLLRRVDRSAKARSAGTVEELESILESGGGVWS